MNKTIELGKIDYLSHNRKDCMVDVEVELKETKRGLEFTASGDIWNDKHTDCYSYGQNLDEIKKFIKSNLFDEIYRLWKLYHLNTMHAGDKEQEEAVNKYLETHNYEYTEVCAYLKSIGLLTHKGYTYGTGWKTEKIPEEDVIKIKKLFD